MANHRAAALLTFPYYDGGPAAAKPPDLPVPQKSLTAAEGYIPDDGLVDAVNVALLLGQPLLVTGEPGTGKTLLADHIAWRLRLGEKERYQAKSTSGARDLFYTYDTLGLFNAAHTGKGGAPLTYLRYQALGRAILLANEAEAVREWLNFEHPGKKRRSVVLIDEVDKAPRDFPNDILAEIEEMKFSIPELGVENISADPSMRPVLVITSNSERQLPEAFLRRCIYYHIPFPDDDRLEEIIRIRIESLKTAPAEFLRDALELFQLLRQKERDLRKKPATAELLNWLSSLEVQPGVIRDGETGKLSWRVENADVVTIEPALERSTPKAKASLKR